MGWQRRRGRQYYIRSQRVGTHVHKVYFGAGAKAQQAAQQDAEAKAKRAAAAAEVAELQANLAAPDQLGAEAKQGVEILADATLLLLGCHEHRGQWRIRRD